MCAHNHDFHVRKARPSRDAIERTQTKRKTITCQVKRELTARAFELAHFNCGLSARFYDISLARRASYFHVPTAVDAISAGFVIHVSTRHDDLATFLCGYVSRFSSVFSVCSFVFCFFLFCLHRLWLRTNGATSYRSVAS